MTTTEHATLEEWDIFKEIVSPENRERLQEAETDQVNSRL